MMNFDEFQSFVADSIKSYLPPEYLGAEVKLNTVVKDNNFELAALCVIKKDANIAPNIYLNGYYNEYLTGRHSMDTLLANIALQRIEAEKTIPKLDLAVDSLENTKNRIIPKVINVEMNRDVLNDRPHKIMGDLAVTYRIIAGRDGGGLASCSIDNKMMKKYGLTVEQLHELAVSNMKVETPSKIKSMAEILGEDIIGQMVADGMSIEEATEIINDMAADAPMYVITNVDGINGASAILDIEAMDKLKDKLGDDVILMPSSIHEFIAIPYEDGMDLDYLKDMVTGINGDVVSPNDFLSNSVYKYDFAKKELVLADTKKTKELDVSDMPGVDKLAEQKNKGGR